MRLAGIVIGKASDAIIARGKKIAAHALEAAEHDIEFADGTFSVKGTDRSIGIFEVARAAGTRSDLPAELTGPLAAECDHTVDVGGFPYGTHVCEVEIDLDLGTVEIAGYVAVDDVGRAVNPRILHGQSHGGIAQGVGQALREYCVYDADGGQLISGSFMDYAIPRADDLLPFTTEISEVLSPNNPLGVRAGGEGGTTPALAVVVNAVVDALKELGVEHMDMPVTAERVWRTTAGQAVRKTAAVRGQDGSAGIAGRSRLLS
jgi:carbon-monoxide dehydrogenase large subunit